MSLDPEDQFIDFIKQTLQKNGFPQKKVSLPYAKIEASATTKGLELEFILARLKMGGIYSDINGEKIIFSNLEFEEEANDNPFDALGLGNFSNLFGGNLDINNLKNMSKGDLQGQVSNLMNNMTPEQQEQLFKMYQNMSDEDKKSILNKGKDLGFF